MKKIKCNVCGYKFYLKKEMVKTVYDNSNLFEIFKGKGTSYYDAVNCPNCSCQKILWPRFKETTREK